MDFESKYSLYGGDKPSPDGEVPLLVNNENKSKLVKNFTIVLVIIVSLVFLVFGIIFSIPHKTRSDMKAEETGEYEVVCEKLDENDEGNTCFNTNYLYEYEHERPEDRFMREVKIGFNFTLFVLLVIVAIMVGILMNEDLQLKDKYVNNGFVKKGLIVFGVILLLVFVLSILTNTGNFFGLEKTLRKSGENKLNESMCKTDGINLSYKLCLQDKDIIGTDPEVREDFGINKKRRDLMKTCTAEFESSVKEELKEDEVIFDHIRKNYTEKEDANGLFKHEKNDYPKSGDSTYTTEQYSNFKDKYDKYTKLNLVVLKKITRTVGKIGNISDESYKEYVPTGQLELDINKAYEYRLQNDEASPFELCVAEVIREFEKTDEHKECDMESKLQKNDKYKTYKTCDQKKEYRAKLSKQNRKRHREQLDGILTDKEWEDADPAAREKAEEDLANAS